MKKKYPRLILIAVLLGLALSPSLVFSQAPFYQGKTLKIINNDPGGTAGMRVKTVMPYLRKYIPGNPTIIVEFVEGGGGRRAANHVFQHAKPDGLTIGALSSSIIGLQVMRETGVMYDIDKFIYLGTPVSENHNVIYTRRSLVSTVWKNCERRAGSSSAPRRWAPWLISRRGFLPTFSI